MGGSVSTPSSSPVRSSCDSNQPPQFGKPVDDNAPPAMNKPLSFEEKAWNKVGYEIVKFNDWSNHQDPKCNLWPIISSKQYSSKKNLWCLSAVSLQHTFSPRESNPFKIRIHVERRRWCGSVWVRSLRHWECSCTTLGWIASILRLREYRKWIRLIVTSRFCFSNRLIMSFCDCLTFVLFSPHAQSTIPTG